MKKAALILLLCACLCSMARADEYMSWVMEKRFVTVTEDRYGMQEYSFYGYGPDGEWGEFITERVIKTLNLSTGEVTETGIPISWIPLQTDGVRDVLLFAVPDGGGCADVIGWQNGAQVVLEQGLQLQSSDERLVAYADGCLYAWYPTDAFPETGIFDAIWVYDRISAKETVSQDVWIDGNPNLPYYTGSKEIPFTIIGDQWLETPTLREIDFREERRIVLRPAEGETNLTTWEIITFDYSDGQMLFWGEPSYDDAETITLYQPDLDNIEGGSCAYASDVVTSTRMQLARFDPDTGEYWRFITEDGGEVMLENLSVIEEHSLYNEKDGCLYVVCFDDCPINWGSAQFEYGFYNVGRTMLARIDLSTGQMDVLYEAGFARPDYERMKEILLKMYGTPLEDGEWRHALSEEDQAISIELAHEKLNPNNPDGYNEQFPENFAIAIWNTDFPE